jgi:hypothetical protein
MGYTLKLAQATWDKLVRANRRGSKIKKYLTSLGLPVQINSKELFLSSIYDMEENRLDLLVQKIAKDRSYHLNIPIEWSYNHWKDQLLRQITGISKDEKDLEIVLLKMCGTGPAIEWDLNYSTKILEHLKMLSSEKNSENQIVNRWINKLERAKPQNK